MPWLRTISVDAISEVNIANDPYPLNRLKSKSVVRVMCHAIRQPTVVLNRIMS